MIAESKDGREKKKYRLLTFEFYTSFIQLFNDAMTKITTMQL